MYAVQEIEYIPNRLFIRVVQMQLHSQSNGLVNRALAQQSRHHLIQQLGRNPTIPLTQSLQIPQNKSQLFIRTTHIRRHEQIPQPLPPSPLITARQHLNPHLQHRSILRAKLFLRRINYSYSLILSLIRSHPHETLHHTPQRPFMPAHVLRLNSCGGAADVAGAPEPRQGCRRPGQAMPDLGQEVGQGGEGGGVEVGVVGEFGVHVLCEVETVVFPGLIDMSRTLAGKLRVKRVSRFNAYQCDAQNVVIGVLGVICGCVGGVLVGSGGQILGDLLQGYARTL